LEDVGHFRLLPQINGVQEEMIFGAGAVGCVLPILPQDVLG